MIKVSDIVLIFNNDMPTPDVAFKLMVAYCKKSGRNMWEEFGYTFSASAKTVVILERRVNKLLPIGFCNLGYYSLSNTFFVNQGFLTKPVDDILLLTDNVCMKCSKHWNVNPDRMILHSDLPERLWKRWGFEKSKSIIYEKQIGGS